MDSKLNLIYLEPLTRREMEFLQLLANGSSNQEIADKLVVEVSTVKWYNSQIYEKLQVKNRRQAVIRAQTLGILEVTKDQPFHRVQHNLPDDALPFIGRKREIKELVQQLTRDELRLITILGPGGMGKSRLAIEVGRQLLAHFRDGIYFISLAPVTSTQQIVTTLADVIGFKFYGDTQPTLQLLEHLQKQHMLLIIDNFEHLLDSAVLLTDILKAAPYIKVLVTSREKLELGGEVLYVISGLSTPYDENKEATGHDAVKLFVEAASRTTAPVQDTDTGIITTICRILGGMPLAILLAAAWLDTLSLAEIEKELKGGLDILESNLRDAPPRHRGIEAVFDYSWKHLTEHEQVVFRRLSIFQGGFTREAAQAVTGANIRDLQRLVHTSFVQHTVSGRYSIHELLRRYGEAKLTAAGEINSAREKHAQFFAAFITPLGKTPWGMATRVILEQVNSDFENVLAAWYFQVDSKDIQELRRFLDGIWHFLDQYSRSKEGIDLFEPLLAMFQDKSDDAILFCGQLIARLAWFYSDIGQPQKSTELAKQALQIVQPLNSTNDILLINFEFYLGLIMTMYETGEWKPYAEKGYELAQSTADPKWMPPMIVAKSTCYSYLGQYEAAQRLLDLVPEYKFKTTMEIAMLVGLGKFDQAEILIHDGLNKYHLHRVEYIIWHINLVTCCIKTNDYKKAWIYVRRGLQYGGDGAYAWGTFWILSEALSLHMVEEQYNLAAELWSFMLHHPLNVEWIRMAVSVHEETLRAKLTVDELEAAWNRGKHLDLGDVITKYMEY